MEHPRYRDAVTGALPWIAGFLAIALLASAVLAFLDGAAGAVATLLTAVAIAGLAGWWFRRPPPDARAYPTAVVLLLGPAILLGWRMAVAGDPTATIGFVLLAIAASAVLLDTLWAVIVTVALWGCWIAAAVFGAAPGSTQTWATWVIGLATATLLGAALHVSRRRSLAELDTAIAEAQAAAVTDSLTGVANRRGLLLAAEPMAETARRSGAAVHCLFIDIDGFKQINDRLGHAAGDDVLLAVAEALREVTRSTDVVARWGGDEFVVVGPGTGMAPLDLERRIAEQIRALPPVPADVWDAAVSVGSAHEPPWEQDSLERLVDSADQAMYRRRDLLRRTRPARPVEGSAELPGDPGDPAEPPAPAEPGVG